ncbi:hypothetical protein Tco_0602547, partial [Tanacetum coccineum]
VKDLFIGINIDEDQAGSDPEISRVALAGPDPEPTLDEFMADLYPKLGKLNVETKVVFMVTVPIYQASSLVPPLHTPVTDLSPPKPASSTTQAPIFTTATTITTLPPHPQQQSTTESELSERVAALEKHQSRFWTNKDVERSKEFIHAIERRLKTSRIFQNLECFVGGRVYDIDYRLLQRTE